MHYNGPCSIEVNNYPRNGSGDITSYKDQTGSRYETITCSGYEQWFGVEYDWELKRDPMIDQVVDTAGNGQTEETSGKYVSPTFDSGQPGGQNNYHPLLDHRSVFYALNQMRYFTTQNMFSQYAPARSDEEIHPEVGANLGGGYPSGEPRRDNLHSAA